jgi:hypothetical protein
MKQRHPVESMRRSKSGSCSFTAGTGDDTSDLNQSATSRMMDPKSAALVFKKYESELNRLMETYDHDPLNYTDVAEILQSFFNSTAAISLT